MASDSEAGPQTIELEEVLDLTAAPRLASSVGEARGAELTLDASKVTRVGAQCVQVLLSAEKTWSADGVAFKVSPYSEEFLSGLESLGIPSSLFVEQEAM